MKLVEQLRARLARRRERAIEEQTRQPDGRRLDEEGLAAATHQPVLPPTFPGHGI